MNNYCCQCGQELRGLTNCNYCPNCGNALNGNTFFETLYFDWGSVQLQKIPEGQTWENINPDGSITLDWDFSKYRGK